MNFFDEYQARLNRISDRENYIYLSALVQQLNERKYIDSLKAEEKLQVVETLINKAELFQRGSNQYHVKMQLSYKYFKGI